jgi:hypothetical protein
MTEEVEEVAEAAQEEEVPQEAVVVTEEDPEAEVDPEVPQERAHEPSIQS